MTLRGGLSYLAAQSVYGVTSHYDTDEWPDILEYAQLPALLWRLIPTRDQHETQAMTMLTLDESVWWATWYVEGLCYWMPAGTGRLAEYNREMLRSVEELFAVLAGAADLNGNLAEPLSVMTADIDYYGYPDPGKQVNLHHAYRVLMRVKTKVEP